MRFLWSIATFPLAVIRDRIWPDDFERTKAEIAADLQRLADNNL